MVITQPESLFTNSIFSILFETGHRTILQTQLPQATILDLALLDILKRGEDFVSYSKIIKSPSWQIGSSVYNTLCYAAMSRSVGRDDSHALASAVASSSSNVF